MPSSLDGCSFGRLLLIVAVRHRSQHHLSHLHCVIGQKTLLVLLLLLLLLHLSPGDGPQSKIVMVLPLYCYCFDLTV